MRDHLKIPFYKNSLVYWKIRISEGLALCLKRLIEILCSGSFYIGALPRLIAGVNIQLHKYSLLLLLTKNYLYNVANGQPANNHFSLVTKATQAGSPNTTACDKNECHLELLLITTFYKLIVVICISQ